MPHSASSDCSYDGSDMPSVRSVLSCHQFCFPSFPCSFLLCTNSFYLLFRVLPFIIAHKGGVLCYETFFEKDPCHLRCGAAARALRLYSRICTFEKTLGIFLPAGICFCHDRDTGHSLRRLSRQQKSSQSIRSGSAVTGLQIDPRFQIHSDDRGSVSFSKNSYLITRIQPSGASILPI